MGAQEADVHLLGWKKDTDHQPVPVSSDVDDPTVPANIICTRIPGAHIGALFLRSSYYLMANFSGTAGVGSRYGSRGSRPLRKNARTIRWAGCPLTLPKGIPRKATPQQAGLALAEQLFGVDWLALDE